MYKWFALEYKNCQLLPKEIKFIGAAILYYDEKTLCLFRGMDYQIDCLEISRHHQA